MTLRRQGLRLALLAAATCLAALLGERLLGLLLPYPLAKVEALERSTVLTAADGRWLQVWPTSRGERVIETGWDGLPRHFQQAILLSEDARFFAHSGVDGLAVLRAVGQNLSQGRVVSGASTLSMQVVRIVEPRPRSLPSKLIEAFRARQLERELGKQRILDLWVTQVPMGGTLRGMSSASRYWFDKPAAELSPAEAAMLVSMVPAPSARAPHRNPSLLKERRDALLRRMAERGVLDAAQLATAVEVSLDAARHAWPQHAWHLCAAEQKRGAARAEWRTGADLALQRRLEAWAASREELPADGLALVVLDRHDASLRALVASRQARPGELDLSRCRRSVGSTLKPFLFALAMEQGSLSESALIEDAPLELGRWRPANFGGGHAGRTRPAAALASSANLPAVHCLQRAGVESFHQLLSQLGLPVDPDGIHLDAALGTLAASPLELAHAYQRFAAHPEQVGLSRRSVDWTLRAMSRLPLGEELAISGRVAWKSGTSSGQRDAWCVALTDDAVLVLWLGNRSGRGEADLVGARTATALFGEVIPLL